PEEILMSEISRRELLLSIPALALAPRYFAQAGKPTIAVKTLNHFTLAISDVKRSVDFYQGLFGMPIQQRQGSTGILRIGNGPQYMALTPTSDAPSIVATVEMDVDSFNPDQTVSVLAQHSVMKAKASDPKLSNDAMKVRTSKRKDTNELFFKDPNGLVV